jgi:small conductance mechanosensitive channel
MRILVAMSGLLIGIDHAEWSTFGHLVARKSAALVSLVVIALIVRWVLHRLIDKLVSKAEDGVLPDRISHVAIGRSDNETTPGSTRRVQRAKTMGTVLKSIVSGILAAIVVTMMLAELGLDIGPIIASAGIVGVALGFGAQALVKDFVSGFFMLAEDQFGVGDGITVLDVTGTVEEVNLRMTRLRATDGTVWFIPNGEIRKVGNSAKEWSRAIVDVTIPVTADVDAASAAIAEEIASLGQDPEWSGAVLETPEVLGTESIGPEQVTLRVTARTNPPDRARVARELRARIGARLRRDGILPAREAAAAPSPPDGG